MNNIKGGIINCKECKESFIICGIEGALKYAEHVGLHTTQWLIKEDLIKDEHK